MDIQVSSQHPFSAYTDLAAERLGGRALLCSDDFFAGMENLLKPGRGIFIADKYTDRGKWMDGWESRRKRVPGHDWCIIRLGASGIIHGVDIDTNHFLGNHPPHASIDACYVDDDAACLSETFTGWKSILHRVDLKPGSQHFFEIADRGHFSHLRLNIFPDGGVARLKVYGDVVKDWQAIGPNRLVDLAAAVNGARSVLCNDMFFSHMDNLIMPGRGVNMGDGWETKRNRTPNNRDWVIVRLAHTGMVHDVCVDTCHFKGNYPDSCMLEACLAPEDTDFSLAQVDWQPLLPQTKLRADAEHFYKDELVNTDKLFSHVRLTILPDGGISRLRVNGFVRS